MKKHKSESVCVWSKGEGETYDDQLYETSCNHISALIDGTLEENNMRFCCYCGKKLKEKRAK